MSDERLKNYISQEDDIMPCLECKKDFNIQTDILLCQDCMKLFDTDRLWELHDDNKLDALDFNESEKFRNKFRLKCIKCKKNKPIEYEEIGLGKYCQDCLDEEHEIYLKEGGI